MADNFLQAVAAHRLSNGPTLKKNGHSPKTDTSTRMVLSRGGVPLCWGQRPISMMLNPRRVISSFGPRATIQRTNTSANILNRLMAVSTTLRVGTGTSSQIYPQRALVSLSVLQVMLCCGTRFCVIPGSANVRDVPRFGLFARYAHEKWEEIKYEIPENLWKYWAI